MKYEDWNHECEDKCKDRNHECEDKCKDRNHECEDNCKDWNHKCEDNCKEDNCKEDNCKEDNYKEDNCKEEQTHVHEVLGSVRLAELEEDPHNHRFAGVTCEVIRVAGGHIHKFQTKTDFYEDQFPSDLRKNRS